MEDDENGFEFEYPVRTIYFLSKMMIGGIPAAIHLPRRKVDNAKFLALFRFPDDLLEFVEAFPELADVSTHEIDSAHDLIELCHLMKLRDCEYATFDFRPKSTYIRYFKIEELIDYARSQRGF